MTSLTTTQTGRDFRLAAGAWALVGALTLLISVSFRGGLGAMWDTWLARPEYSHGPIIPLLAAFLVWQKKDDLRAIEFRGSWLGVVLVAFGLLLNFAGHMATLYVVQQYALVIVIYGVVLAFTGTAVVRLLWMPLFLLAFMIPLPQFLLGNLSAQLQLISSHIGVWVIRLFGISVHLEGNVIDLGEYKLQVAEACDGLRYLFPLMTLGLIMAYFYRAAPWKRTLVFVSSIPITILMNSFRIGVIGITVEHWGVGMAEGFLHEFQGWVVFMASIAIMLVLMAFLGRIGPDRGPFRDLFAVDFPSRSIAHGAEVKRLVPASMIAATALIASYATLHILLPERAEAVPIRPSFVTFPERLGPWVGRTDSLDAVYLEKLRLSDYFLGEFRKPNLPPVSLYVAWYDSQRSGQSAHSPRSCLPGGGWRIDDVSQVTLAGVEGPNGPVAVNRVLISLGNDRQLVYYWFQQRGRVITNEYLVKWYLFWDAITRSRTDGALVRVTTPLAQGEDPARGDARLEDFASQSVPRLSAFIPE